MNNFSTIHQNISFYLLHSRIYNIMKHRTMNYDIEYTKSIFILIFNRIGVKLNKTSVQIKKYTIYSLCDKKNRSGFPRKM